MTTVRLNGKRYACPSTWMEVTTKQYIRIIKEWDQDKDIADRDYLQLLCILTGADFSAMSRSIENELSIMNLIGWFITEDFSFHVAPKVFEYKDKLIDISHPGELSIGQNIHLRRDYMDKSKSVEENIAIATAIYLQPIIDEKPFNIRRAQALSHEFEGMPVHVIYPIGFFLLRRAMSFGHKPGKIWPRILNSLRRMLLKMWPGSRNRANYTPSTTSH